MKAGQTYSDLGEQAVRWVLAQVRDEPEGAWLPSNIATDDVQGSAGPDDFWDSIYKGVGGLGLLLSEVRLMRAWTPAEAGLVARIVGRLAGPAVRRADATLYSGLAGDVAVLTHLAPDLVPATLERLADLATPHGWLSTEGQWAGQPINDVVMGTAGIVLTGVWQGGDAGLQVARAGVNALLTCAVPTKDGLDWPMSSITRRRTPNFSHGTAGVVAALAVAGTALDDHRATDAARRGAEHLVAIADRSAGGLRVPIMVPREANDGERFTYSWCHGSTGTSYAFAALAAAGVDGVAGVAPGEWRRRCLHAVRASGIPQRLRPGFWDNDGRCCGTAGAGAAFLDAAQAAARSASALAEGTAGSEDLTYAAACRAFAARLGDALIQRAVVDERGARWRFIEHRLEQPVLAPATGWMQGAAGIAAYLLRLGRVLDDGLGAAALDLPDQWWAVPAEVSATRAQRRWM